MPRVSRELNVPWSLLLGLIGISGAASQVMTGLSGVEYSEVGQAVPDSARYAYMQALHMFL